MQDHKPKYWRGIEELENTPEFAKNAYNEFPEYLPVLNNKSEEGASSAMPTADRRDFLKLMGFSVAAATLASCEAPVRKAIPYLNKPEEIEPGIANWYASTYFEGGDYNAVLVKTREGRPIKLEGNPLSTLTRGGLSARAQASVLNLYDDARLKGPKANKKDATWEEIDRAVTAGLGQGGRVVLVSQTIISPSTKKLINEFVGRFGGEHVTYDANSYSAIAQAYESSHGKRMIPSYDFSKPDVIVSVGADFINTWLNPIEQAKQYITKRKVSSDNRKMSKHYQFETMMTVTGANSDVRVPVRPSEEAMVVAALFNRIAGGSISVPAMAKADKQIEKAASELMAARGAALVVSGSKDAAVQLMVNRINEALGAFGTVIDTNTPTYTRQGNDQQMMNFISNMSGVGTVIFYNANPVYDHPMGEQIAAGLKNVATSVSFSDREDETAQHCKFICPDHNYLESWNDFEPKKGYLSLAQPTISPLFNTRQAQDSLLVWTGSNSDYYTYLQRNWRGILSGSFVSAWDKAVHDGVYQAGAGYSSIFDQTTSAGGGAVDVNSVSFSASKDVELGLYETAAMGNGAHANNPWLLEMADPITRACWDNYLCMSQAMAKNLDLEQGNMVKVTAKNGKTSATLPMIVQPGMPDNAVAIALGWGRTHAGPAAKGVGVNAYPFAQVSQNGLVFMNTVSLEKTGENKEIAQVQTHHTLMGRIVVQDSTLGKYQKDPKSVTERIRISTPLDPSGTAAPSEVSLWKDYDYKNHHWGMVIDLNSCIGCGSCTLGCQAENNVPVVGKAEVLMRREMHWLRIDRYYSSDATREDGGFTAMEDPSENPAVIFQPMLCQQCNHAPCETVCPVAATTHSSEGLNQMAYNRCIGTRYCANNCPYKVRRFNWFNYQNDHRIVDVNLTSDLQRMVLNPDVTVRARGVMEKCTFCVQRIQLGKLEAKKERRRPVDGEIVTACAQSCPTNAIVFGDMNDPESQVSKILQREKDERAFHVLEELNVQPNVTYLTKIRNTDTTVLNRA